MRHEFRLINNVAVFLEPHDGHPFDHGNYLNENAPSVKNMLIPSDELTAPGWYHYSRLANNRPYAHWSFEGHIEAASETQAANLVRQTA